MLGILLGRTEPRASTKSPYDDFWYQEAGSVSASGFPISPEGALRHLAVYACVRILAEAVAALPIKVYRRRRDGGKEVADGHWLYRTLHDKPNNIQTPVEFFEFLMYCLCLRGNFYADIVGTGDMLLPIHPDNVTKIRQVNSSQGPMLTFEIRRDNGRRQDVVQEDLFRVQGLSSDGVSGLAPITVLRNAVGMALAAEEFGSSLFKQGVRPSGVFEHPSKLSPEAFARLRDSMATHAGSGNAGKSLILEEGMAWKQVSMTPDDAQFLETRKLQIEEIARAYRVPLHMLQSMDRATFSNIEHMAIEFVVHSLRPWLVRIEKSIKRDLIWHEKTMFAEFLVDGLLRGDVKTRYESYGIAIANRIMSPNEIRDKENMNPYEGGDVYENPNTMSKGNQTQPDNLDSSSQPNQVSRAFAADIAGRIATWELKELAKHAKHQKADPAKFREWATEFYNGHAQRIDQAIATFCDAHEVREADRIAVVEKLTAGQCSQLANGNAEELVESWSKNLQAQHAETLLELVA